MTTNRRPLSSRADAVEAELHRRRSSSEQQAAHSLENDNREAEEDERPTEELSTSERQVHALVAKRGGRGGRSWREVTP